MEPFKFIMTQDDCDTISRKSYVDFENTYVYIKPINKACEMLKGGYDSKNTMVVEVLKGKCVFHDGGNYATTKYYNYDDVNGNFLLDRLRLCFLLLNSVNYVRYIIKE